MNPTQKEIYEKTVKRLALKGIKDPTGQIIDLAEEIERYRSKIKHMQAYIQANCHGLQCPPKPKEGRYTKYDPELERFVVPCFYKLNGEQITFYCKDEPGDVTRVWGEVIDALAYYESQEEAKEAERCDECKRKDCEQCEYKKKLEEILSRPDCNDCDASTTNACGMCPPPVAAVRINCPYIDQKGRRTHEQ